ncbi:AAA family ATPase [Nonomuraea sp. NPDC049709]|uniref:AAA family ATPase n=1 Tax=Nonomuraea sp. NPDC049709 TaxID=3154736 RepID=UPI0034190244
MGGEQPRIIVFTGLPGTGKSTLADRVAMAIGAPAFAGDWLMGSLKPHGLLRNLDRPAFLSMYYDLLSTLVTRQLMLGQSAVVDCLVNDDVVARWQELSDRYDARLIVIECLCSDVEIHRRRVEGRKRGIPGWHEVGWDHVERMRREFPSLAQEHLVLDAVDSVESNLRLALGCIGKP